MSTESAESLAQLHADRSLAHPHETELLDVDRCLEELAQLAQSELAPRDFYAALLDRALRVLPAVGGAVWQRLEKGRAELLCQLHFPEPMVDRRRPALPDSISPPQPESFVLPAYARASSLYPADNPHPWPLVVCSLVADLPTSIVIEIALARDTTSDVQAGAARLVGVLAEIADDFHRRQELARLRLRDANLTLVTDLVTRLHARLDPVATALTMANDGRQWIGCDRVSVMRLAHGRAVTLAVSAVEHVDRRSGQVAALERLASAVAASGEPLVWHEQRLDDLPPELAGVLHAYLDLGHARQLIALPLRHAAEEPQSSAHAPPPVPPHGMLVVESFVADRPLETLSERADELARLSGSALGNALTHHSLPLLPLQTRLAKLIGAISRRPIAALLGLFVLTAAIALLAIVPADFTVEAEGTLQPQLRRNLFAPSDGVVEEVRVEHGAQIAKGDVLLRIRSPGLDLDQSRLSGELQTAQARLDAVRSARSQTDQAAAAGDPDRLASEEEQLKQQILGLENQLAVVLQLREELNVASPLTGVVLTWNTHQLLDDRPVKQGQTLIAVAESAGPWQLELRVPDSEAGHVLAGKQAGDLKSPVTFLLASDPAVTHHGHLARVALATDTAGGQSAAETIVALDGPLPADARAGARVIARIHCGRRSIGYVWLHDLFDFVRTSLLF
jgi:multidrug efflux pump subunit AcrA (membrane-fusion protein)